MPLLTGRAVLACEGAGRVEAAVVARLDQAWRPLPGTERRFEVDAVCASFGFVPRLELARQLGARERVAAGHPAVTVECDESMATSVHGLFVAGELTGVGGAEVAELEGETAGHAAAGLLGLADRRAATQVALQRRRLVAAQRFAAGLAPWWRLRAGALDWAPGDTVVCRCEDVTMGALRAALAEGAESARDVRNRTRCGMGYCQGRTCGPVVQLALASSTGRPIDEVGDLNKRPVAVPVPLGEVAAPDAGV